MAPVKRSATLTGLRAASPAARRRVETVLPLTPPTPPAATPARPPPRTGSGAIPCRESRERNGIRTLLCMSNPLDIKQWADRYVAQWNEPDPAARAALIREVWALDGV